MRTRPRNVQSLTGSKDLQMVNITLRILTKPSVSKGKGKGTRRTTTQPLHRSTASTPQHPSASVGGAYDIVTTNPPRPTVRPITALPTTQVSDLPAIFRSLGPDFDDKVLPSIVNEVLKAVVARFNAVIVALHWSCPAVSWRFLCLCASHTHTHTHTHTHSLSLSRAE